MPGKTIVGSAAMAIGTTSVTARRTHGSRREGSAGGRGASLTVLTVLRPYGRAVVAARRGLRSGARRGGGHAVDVLAVQAAVRDRVREGDEADELSQLDDGRRRELIDPARDVRVGEEVLVRRVAVEELARVLLMDLAHAVALAHPIEALD